ncbi:DNA repair protein RadC [Halorhodospira abdelmalekii]|uniref:RadC family protein n=1 Tax=Halorhodospira abdelmalekii TaxID=421629 RepID=UPI0019043DDA|nr:DNA repair protein RadC [Halorhodospira abdelmalekii]MBK1734883.1 DNA repair protein RadC [Halorhodospira abdelmalekii]
MFDEVPEEQVLEHATKLLEARMQDWICEYGPRFTAPADARRFLHLKLASREHEVFAVLFLDTRHRLIDFAELFRGTIDGTTVHPREVVKEALRRNASAAILAHNHPSGCSEPSSADTVLTERLKEALALVDVRVLDHIVIGHQLDQTVSLAERGLM